jgi:threonyl-tRNA synthetase
MNAVAAEQALDAIDHRDLVQAMDLAHFEAHSPGVVFWHAPGARVLRRLEAYARHLHEAEGYQEVRSPQLLSRSLWERSGHWAKYRDGMYVVGEGDLALKPMSCPGHLAIYADARRSYRDLPYRMFEFGAVHRQEPSGALSGLLRLRGFVQDDAHVLVQEDQIQEGVAAFVRLVEQAYPALGFESWSYRLALRPEQRAGSDALWDKAEGALRAAVERLGLQAEEAIGEGAFYGPKLEVSLRDRLGRSWQCGVIQVDFVLPEAFALAFQNAAGQAEQPVLLHHAVFGSLERFLAILLEHHSGLPEGLAPMPVAICPISAAQASEAQALVAELRAVGVPAECVEEGPLPGRLRHLADRQVPLWGVLGAREVAAGQVSVRRRGEAQGQVVDRAAWVARLAADWQRLPPALRLG